VITKCLAAGADAGGTVDMQRLEQIHRQEAQHFELVREAIEELGGDPTAMTPCADLVGVQSLGLIQAVNEPRTTIAQALNTLLIAELTDNAGWELLITLANELGHTGMAERFTTALAHEQEHLATVKTWLQEVTLAESKVLAATG
jgi:hypothetical protein